MPAKRRGPGTAFMAHIRVKGEQYRVHPSQVGQSARIEVYRYGRWRRIPSSSAEARKAIRAMHAARAVANREQSRFIPAKSSRGLILRVRRWFSRLWRRFRER